MVSFRRQDRRVFQKDSHCKDVSGGPVAKTLCPNAGGPGSVLVREVDPTPLPFGERTRDCSPGHAGKEGPQLVRTGASQGFRRAAAPVGVKSTP